MIRGRSPNRRPTRGVRGALFIRPKCRVFYSLADDKRPRHDWTLRILRFKARDRFPVPFLPGDPSPDTP